MNKLILSSLFLLATVFSTEVSAQITDLARVEYTYFPQSDSDNSFRRFRTFANFPIKLSDNSTYLIPGVEYRNIHFKFNDVKPYETAKLDRFQSFLAKLAYTVPMKNDWRFAAEIGMRAASNFSTNDLVNDDFIYTGSVYFIKIKEDERYVQPWRLILGLNYSTTTGLPVPLPIINYYKRFDEKWSYSVGTPKSNIRYFFNDKHNVQGFVTLDGFFANIQDNFFPAETSPAVAESISMTIVLSGLGYEYSFTDHISFYSYAGWTLMNDIRLRDGNLDDLETLNDTNTFYARAGLKFSIL